MTSHHFKWPDQLILAALASVFAVLALPAGPLRFLATLPLVVWLPGFALMRAMGRQLVRGLEGFCLVVGISMSIAILTGYGLNAIGRMTPEGWAIALATVVVLCTLVSPHSDRNRNFLLPLWVRLESLRPLSGAACLKVGLVLASMGIAGGAYAIALDGFTRYRQFKYTELWMVPDQPARSDTVRIGVRNMEGEPSNYQLQVMQDGALIAQLSAIALDDGGQWAVPVTVSFDPQKPSRIEARLYNSAEPHRLYRQVWLSINQH